MFGETAVFYVKDWNHPTETNIKKLMFTVPGMPYFQNKNHKTFTNTSSIIPKLLPYVK